jgi:hypothetical protein
MSGDASNDNHSHLKVKRFATEFGKKVGLLTHATLGQILISQAQPISFKIQGLSESTSKHPGLNQQERHRLNISIRNCITFSAPTAPSWEAESLL